jgi:hypothetical protein
MKSFVLRGALAGVAGAAATVLVLLILGEQSIRDAIAIEEAAGGGGDEPLFTRPEQVLGGSIGVALYAVLIGTIFGIVYAATRHWIGRVPEWKRAFRLAGLAFTAVYLVPFVKYPPNPPAVGDPETVNDRTIAYLAMLGIGIVAIVLAFRLAQALRAQGWGSPVTAPAAVALFVAIVAVAYALLPANDDPIEVGAKLIWRFRMASLGGQVAFWAVFGTVFAWLSIQAEGGTPFARRQVEEPEPAGA